MSNQEVQGRSSDEEVLILPWWSQAGKKGIDNKFLLIRVKEVEVVLVIVG